MWKSQTSFHLVYGLYLELLEIFINIIGSRKGYIFEPQANWSWLTWVVGRAYWVNSSGTNPLGFLQITKFTESCKDATYAITPTPNPASHLPALTMLRESQALHRVLGALTSLGHAFLTTPPSPCAPATYTASLSDLPKHFSQSSLDPVLSPTPYILLHIFSHLAACCCL